MIDVAPRGRVAIVTLRRPMAGAEPLLQGWLSHARGRPCRQGVTRFGGFYAVN